MKPIPSPAGHILIGNVLDIDPDQPQESLARLANIYGPIFKLQLSSPRVFVASHAIANELCDERRFCKAVTGALEEVRNAAKDGLFTAYPGEHNWEIAHRILMPAFGPLSIRGMFDEMQDIVSQMVAKWARFGSDVPIDASEDFTKLTLDSIALCAMGERFNSFYHDDLHPFVHAMGGMLAESGARTRRPEIIRPLYRASNEKYHKDIQLLEDTARTLLKRRRENPTTKKDLLNSMINGKDPKTGEQLSDDSIIRNMITFLIAGHETTSGLLSFLFYELLDHPKALSTLVEEVDRVVGRDPVTVSHLSQLPYMEACLRECLRLHSPAPAFTLQAIGDQIVGGEYEIKDGETASILLECMHRDPEVWGEDADLFKPERMLEESFNKLPRNAWKPFGNGARGCIGKPFAWQEALIAVATILQTFHITKDSPSYKLQIRTSLTIKPKDFFIRARLRDPEFVHRLNATSSSTSQGSAEKGAGQNKSAANADEKQSLPPLDIVFGSNTGTCESLAQALASDAQQNGFSPTIKTLDSALRSLSKSTPTVIITASYEGQPPENGMHFCEWLSAASKDEFKGVSYAVFGLGNKEWHTTYQRIPTLVDATLSEKGATRIADRASIDVGHDNIFDLFEQWQTKSLWPALRKLSGGSDKPQAQQAVRELSITLGTNSRSKFLRHDVLPALVTETGLLTKEGAARKRCLRIKLPSEATYRAGDYLAVLPLNHPSVIRRVMSRFQLPWDATISIAEGANTPLPTGQELSVHDILSGMLELSQPITNRLAQHVAEANPVREEAEELEKRIADGEFNKTSVTLLDLLEEYSSSAITFGQFLAAMPPMHLRQYSISSTALKDPSQCSLTYSVLDEPAKGSRKGRQFHGVASTYLERLAVGDYLQVAIRPSRNGFHLPKDNSKPIIMACAGTGLAPFRGFVEERALLKEGGQQLGPMILFYGCRAADMDDLYREEFDKWESEGIVSVRRAYSATSDASEGCKHVQDRIWFDRSDVVELYKKDAQVYICGAGAVGKGIEDAFARIRTEVTGEDLQAALGWVHERKGTRYWSDVFS